jgi:hypothetical protein
MNKRVVRTLIAERTTPEIWIIQIG